MKRQTGAFGESSSLTWQHPEEHHDMMHLHIGGGLLLLLLFLLAAACRLLRDLATILLPPFAIPDILELVFEAELWSRF